MESFFHGLRVWYYRTRTFCRENGGRRNMNLGFSFFFKQENAVLQIRGRHDPAIVHRARIVMDAVTAIAVYDMLSGRFGTDYFAKEA